MEQTFKEAEDFGRQMLASGALEELRQWFSLSMTQLAACLHTNTTSLRSWLGEPSSVQRMHATTAARIGELAFDLTKKAQDLLNDEGVRIFDLYPLRLLAGEMGRSVTSPAFTEMCRTRAITCYDMGSFGVYIPKGEAEALKAAKK